MCLVGQGALPLTLPRHPLTSHELCEGLGAGGWDGQCELVNSHSVGHSKAVDATVGHLSSQQFPQQHPKAVCRGGDKESVFNTHCHLTQEQPGTKWLGPSP